MAVVVIVEAPQGRSTRYAEDRLGGPSVLHHPDLGHPSSDSLIGIDVVVRLDEAHPAVRVCPADAVEVDELVALDGFPAALVLPATHLHDDVHDVTLGPAGRPHGLLGALAWPSEWHSCRA